MRVRYTAQAVGELEDILQYLHRRNPTAAAAVADRIEAQIARLERFPFMGHAKYRPDVRMCRVGRYPFLIFYSIAGEDVRILSIRHAARRPLDDSGA